MIGQLELLIKARANLIEMVSYEDKRIRMTEYLEKRLETDKLSHAEFCEIRNALCSAKIGEEFEKINLAATAKYGKAVND